MEEIRTVAPADLSTILRLNDAEVEQTSPMALGSLESLVGMAAYRKVAIVDGGVAAFIIALADSACYENANFEWFASRVSNFLYVDRVVVGAAYARQRIGSKLYADLFAFAREVGVDNVVCEYNLLPPNPASRAFHEKFGFEEIGTQWVARGTKHVSMQRAATR